MRLCSDSRLCLFWLSRGWDFSEEFVQGFDDLHCLAAIRRGEERRGTYWFISQIALPTICYVSNSTSSYMGKAATSSADS
jgi:hypothetical protein